MINFLTATGKLVESFCEHLGLYASTFVATVRRLASRPWHVRMLILQAEEVGVQSLPVVMLTALFTG
ncbi:MAG: ABC transporter permease, partial [Mariprofundus sp.]